MSGVDLWRLELLLLLLTLNICRAGVLLVLVAIFVSNAPLRARSGIVSVILLV